MPGLAGRALLVIPPGTRFLRDDRCQGPVDLAAVEPNRAPMDLAYAAALLRRAGWETRIRDFPTEERGDTSLERELLEFAPTALVVSTTAPTLTADLAACRLAGRVCPDALVVAKGPHLLDAREALSREDCLDAAVYDDPEFHLARAVAEAPAFEGVPGVVYRRHGRPVVNPPPPDPPSLDDLPPPARDQLRNELYVAPDTGEPLGVVLAGKGCPFDCIFCLAPRLSRGRVRLRTPERIVEEMESCVLHHGIRSFFLRADTFTLDRDWTLRFCRCLLEAGLDVRWGANSRVDTVDPELLALMGRAGCWVLAFGLESGSQEMLDRMGKRARLAAARRAVRACRRSGIRSHCMYVLGLPGETEGTTLETIRFAVALDSDFADFNVAYPMPGTALYELALAEGLFDPADLYGGDYARPIMRTGALSTDDLARLRRRAMRAFYLRPGYIWRTLSRVRSPRELAGYLSAGLRLGRGLLPGAASGCRPAGRPVAPGGLS